MDEKLRILKMVEEGIITAEQASELISALGESVPFEGELPVPAENVPYESRMLRILVESEDGDHIRVQFPVKAIRAMLKVTGKLPVQLGENSTVDVAALTETVIDCLDSEMVGDIVSVDSADGDRVRVFIG